MKPIILYEYDYSLNDLKKLRRRPHWSTIDIYENQSKELFEITHPSLVGKPSYVKKLKLFLRKRIKISAGSWIYYPWNGMLLHMVTEKEYNLLRTNRNRNLITREEQSKLHHSCVAIAGLSVGSGIASTLTYQGIGTMKLAEFDSLETTNLNRMRATILDVGKKKIDIVCEQLYEINPYLTVTPYPDGLTKTNLLSFVHKKPKPNVIFEIIDDFEMKILLRVEARKARIPVISTANLGDSVLIDVERFDLNPRLPLFNGVLGNLPEQILKHPDADKHNYAVRMVGKHFVPPRALASVAQIGKTLVGRPQLGSTVTMSSGISSYITRLIILGDNLASGRYHVVWSDMLKSPAANVTNRNS